MGERKHGATTVEEVLTTMVSVDLEGSPDLQGALSRIGYKYTQ